MLQKRDKRAAEFQRVKASVDVLQRELRETQLLLQDADVRNQVGDVRSVLFCGMPHTCRPSNSTMTSCKPRMPRCTIKWT